MDWIQNKVNSAAGGGKSSEKNEDGLDKAIDYVQENVLGQGKQDNGKEPLVIIPIQQTRLRQLLIFV